MPVHWLGVPGTCSALRDSPRCDQASPRRRWVVARAAGDKSFGRPGGNMQILKGLQCGDVF